MPERRMGVVESAAEMEDVAEREIVLSRVFDAPRKMVWEAWTDPKQVAQWWGPKGFTTTIEEMDVRPGGVWKQVMHGPDGTDYSNESVFLDVVLYERLVYRECVAAEQADQRCRLKKRRSLKRQREERG
jgi:uncharacterized protein YndB with AHSA1/START domain